MSIQDHDQDRIERYLQGLLSAEEGAALEAACAQDPALAEALAHERDLRTLARAVRLLELKEALARSARRQRMRPRLLVASFAVSAAAAILLLVYIGWLRAPGYQSLAQELIAAEGIKSAAEADSLERARNFLARDQPQEAIPILWRQRAQGSDDASYYLGLAYALEREPDSSRLYLDRYLQAHPQDGQAPHARALRQALPQ